MAKKTSLFAYFFPINTIYRRGEIDLKRNIKENFAKNVVLLMISQVIIKIVGLIYKLYITNKQGFGDTGNAIYSAGFQVYALFLTISSVGVPNAISKLTSARLAVGDNKGAYRVLKIAIAIFGTIRFFRKYDIILRGRVICRKIFTNAVS